MASARPLSVDDVRLEVRRRFSDPARHAPSAEALQSLSEPTVPTAAEATTSTSKHRTPNSPGSALDSAAKGPRWSRVDHASRMQLAVEEAEKVADVAGAATQLMRLSTAFAGEPSPRNAPGQKRAALLADIAAGSRTRNGLKSPPKERRGSVNTPPKWMLGVHRMLGVQFGGRSQELLAEGPTPLGQVTTTGSNSAPSSVS